MKISPEFVDELVRLKLVGLWTHHATEDGRRDAVAHATVALLRSGKPWTEALAQVTPPRKGRQYRFMLPVEYLEKVAVREGGGKGRHDDGEEIVVCGDLHAYWPDGEGDWTEFPRAIVIGEAIIHGCEKLERAELVTYGKLDFDNCPRLRAFSGECFGEAIFTGCGLRGLGADFRTAGSLTLKMCPDISCVNCDVGFNFLASDCSLARTGAAFSVGGSAHISNCPLFSKLRGRIEGKAEISGTTLARVGGAVSDGGEGRTVSVPATREP